jgi:hypothetical protein
MPRMLLLLFSIASIVGLSVFVLLARHAAIRRRQLGLAERSAPPLDQLCVFRCPDRWLAVKSRSSFAVQSALGLHNPKPCSWVQGLAGEEKLFIAPPVRGWVLVLGSGLPDPAEDVDASFRFLLNLSRRLGQVQFFSISRVLHHHAWVKADSGRILRAYAWAGKTLWCQGEPSCAEQELELKCFDYLQSPEPPHFGQPDLAALNVERVPLLAARWSIDPGRIDARFLQMERGIAGEPSWRY